MEFTQEQQDAITSQALAEFSGINETTADSSQESTSDEVAPSIQDENAPVSNETDKLKDTDDKSEQPPAKSEDEIRKEVERKAKKQYLSQVSKKDAELKAALAEIERLKSDGYDDEQIAAIDTIVDARLKARDVNKYESIEKDNFVNEFKPDATTLKGIEEIREAFPSMSYKAARNLYLAETNPESLVKPKTNYGIVGNAHSDTTNGNVDEGAAYLAKIDKLARQFAGL